MIEALLRKLLPEEQKGIVLGSNLVTGEVRDDGTFINFATNLVKLHKGYGPINRDLGAKPVTVMPVVEGAVQGTYDVVVKVKDSIQVIRRYGLNPEVGSSIRL